MRQTPANQVFLGAQAAALLVIALFIGDLFLNRKSELNTGADRTQRFNAMMAEHTARTFEAVDILLRELSGDLGRNRSEWQRWNEEEGWSFLAQNQSRSMPQLRTLLLYDHNGTQRFTSNLNNGPRLNFRPASDLATLLNGKKAGRIGPLREGDSGQHTFLLSHRISDASGLAHGTIVATLEPAYLQDFCWPNRLSEDFESVLINTSGKIIAACRPSDHGRQSPLLGRQYDEVLFEGRLQGMMPSEGTQIRDGFVMSLLAVPGFPELRMLTAVPENSLLANWLNRLFELGILAFLIVGIILSGGLLMRRQLGKVSAMTKALENSHQELERRIAQATEELAEQRDNAELANVAKSRFLAAASHDLRQPMHALSLFSTDLQSQARSGTYRELPRLAEQIGTSTRVLSELLDSLLDISRLDVTGIVPDIQSFPLQSVFDRVFATHKRNALDKKILLRVRFTRYWLHSDPALLERMIGNLVSNAIRYTPEGGRVLVAARKRGERILIEIRDSGMGIAPEHQTAIFAEFYQVANAARESHQGLGLGLSIVDRLASALKIEIGLSSAINRGTNFSLSVRSSHVPAPIAKQESIENAPPLLYFIGNSDGLSLARQLAESWGYKTEQQTAIDSALPALPYNTIVLTELALAAPVRTIWPGKLTMILFVPEQTPQAEISPPPEGSQLCSLPIRPARLRALLQNTSSKSMP